MAKDERVYYRVTAAQKRLWEQAAARENLTLTGFLTLAADLAASGRAGKPGVALLPSLPALAKELKQVQAELRRVKLLYQPQG